MCSAIPPGEEEADQGCCVEDLFSYRITAASKLLPELKVIPGFAFYLTTSDGDGRPWDFDKKEMRGRAIRRVREHKPMLLIGSPMCTALSPLGNGSTNKSGTQ